MTIRFPYPDVKPLVLPDGCGVTELALPQIRRAETGLAAVQSALENPTESPRLRDLAKGKGRVLIVSDDKTRPTPVRDFLPLVLEELAEAGVAAPDIEFIMSLGTHRPMSRREIAEKLGSGIARRYRVHNHNWRDKDNLEYLGETPQGVTIRVNKILRRFDTVVGLGAIMPIDICGFTGGGKIIVPGLSGEETVDQMHWVRVNVPTEEVIGREDNPIRDAIDTMARRAGLDFIVNVVLDAEGRIVGAFAGDMVAAHRLGCKLAKQVYTVRFPREFDVVIADSHPFDIEFWQANKALDTAGEVVSAGGVIILVSPCYEGLSRTHGAQIFEFGYPPVERIKQLVDSGLLKHKVVGVHMYQVSKAAVEKARLILVSSGIGPAEAEKIGFYWAADPQAAFAAALELVDKNPEIAVLRDAARMLPLKG
jgi:nickel-dependent lactate racemase